MLTHKLLRSKRALCADDVLIELARGMVESRSDVELYPYIYSAPMDTITGYEFAKALLQAGGMPVICRNIPDREYARCLESWAGREDVFFAVGASKPAIDKFMSLLPEGTSCINVAVDIAHGDSIVGENAIKYIRSLGITGHAMSGSICTGEAARRCLDAGYTHLRVGVGPGSMCTTRLMTGCGSPQLSAVFDVHCAAGARGRVIADGGIRTPGDAAKYLAAGADAIMMGSAFKLAAETPGWVQEGFHELDTSETLVFPMPEPTPRFVKRYRGHASASFQTDHKGSASPCPEGETSEALVFENTSTADIVSYYNQGIRSAISYAGITTLRQLSPYLTKMNRITTSAIAESKAHGK